MGGARALHVKRGELLGIDTLPKSSCGVTITKSVVTMLSRHGRGGGCGLLEMWAWVDRRRFGGRGGWGS